MTRCSRTRRRSSIDPATPRGCPVFWGAHVRKNFRRIALGAAIAAGTLLAGVASALPTQSSHAGGGASDDTQYAIGGNANKVFRVVNEARDFGEATLGIGGTNPGPLPGPTPGFHPEDIINGGIQTV